MMGIIDIFLNGFVTFCKSCVTLPKRSVTLRYAFYRLQLAHAVGQCIVRRGVATCSSQVTLGGLVIILASLSINIANSCLSHLSVGLSVGLFVGLCPEGALWQNG